MFVSLLSAILYQGPFFGKRLRNLLSSRQQQKFEIRKNIFVAWNCLEK